MAGAMLRPIRRFAHIGDPRIAPGLGPQRTRIIEIALEELDKGVVEQPLGSNRGPLVDRYLPNWARTRPGPAWCAFFASWVLEKALGNVPTGRVRGSVHALKKDAKERKLWRPSADYEPAPGDLFLQDLGRGLGHTGFIIGSSSVDIETIEGNSGHRVRAGLRSFDDPRLIGFICTVPAEQYDMCWRPGSGTDATEDATR